MSAFCDVERLIPALSRKVATLSVQPAKVATSRLYGSIWPLESSNTDITMIDSRWTDEAVLGELGARLERLRLARNETQEDLAARAGVSRTTVISIEQGRGGTIKALLRVLRAHGLVEGLDALVPVPGVSPIELLEHQGHQRRRASRRPSRSPIDDDDDGPPTPGFQWGTQ